MEQEVIINLCKQISEGLRELDQKPHEFFFPGELELIKSRSPQIQNAAKCEMYQAAAAMLLSSETEIQLLKIRTEKAFQEWMEMFTDYKIKPEQDFYKTPINAIESEYKKAVRDFTKQYAPVSINSR